ncbi:hypothetical protein HYV44_03570 [Candidatus Microgenomates bacterium]|nr:hypothetical protein [Candidatus Microgenomates bacterium]
MTAKKIFKKTLYYTIATIIIVALSVFCLYLALYAAGYRVNTHTWKVQKTGLLVFKSPDGGANIFINGQPAPFKESLLPSIWHNSKSISLFPGEYDLEIKKESYLPYREHIIIVPELITEIEKIIFVPENIQKTSLLEKNIQDFSFAPNSRKMIYTVDRSVNIYDLSKKTDYDLGIKIPDQTKNIRFFWSSDSKRSTVIFIRDIGNIIYWLDTDTREGFYFHQAFSFSPFFEEIFFLDKNNNELFGTNGRDLYQINIAQKNINIAVKNVSSVSGDNQYLYFVQNAEKKLARYDTSIEQIDFVLDDFTPSDDFTILPGANGRQFYILNNGQLGVFSSGEPTISLNDQVTRLLYGDKGYDIYYTRNYEIWRFDPNEIKKEKQNKLITRISQPLSDLREFANNYYLFYTADNRLNLIRLDGSNNTLITDSAVYDFRVVGSSAILVVEQKDSGKSLALISF